MIIDTKLLRELLAANPSDEECPRCHNIFELDDDPDPPVFCDACAQEVVKVEMPALLDELDRLRADNTVLFDRASNSIAWQQGYDEQLAEVTRLRLKILHYQRALVSLGPLVGEARDDINAESRAAKEGDRGG